MAVPVRQYAESALFGLVKTGRVLAEDYVCQSCGTGFHVSSHVRHWIGIVLFALPMIGMGLTGLIGGVIAGLAEGWDAGFAGLAVGTVVSVMGWTALFVIGRPVLIVLASPVVPDAVEPVVRFTQREPIRRCSCGYPVRCHEVIANRLNGVPTGTEYRYRCTVCGHGFTIESPWEAISSIGGSLLLIAVFLVASLIDDITWSGLACSGGIGLVGAFGLTLTLVRLFARVRHPVIPAP
ncbi:MAG: hypothetical protein R3F61_21710 [Myxococcota bacterium]